MLKINSVTFGDLEIDENTIYTFEDGIPGLRGIHKYAIFESEGLEPFRWLQACESPFLSMMMIDPVLIDTSYHVSLSQEHRSLLGDYEPDDLTAMALVVVPKDPKLMTANLLAPIVFNSRSRKGAQIVIEGTKEMLRVRVIKD